MGAVYRVRELETQRGLALKVVLPSSAEVVDLLRFQREGEAAARLTSGGLVRVHSAGTHRGLPFFVMDLVDGEDLETLLKQGLEPEALARVLAEVAAALHSVHEAGLVHRDLKPANILVGSSGAMVADLGLVKDRDAQSLTKTGDLLGTPCYMAPEQVQDARRVDRRTDVYALGAILYRGLAGRPPFSGSIISVLDQVTTQDPPRPSRVRGEAASEFEGICLQAMAKDPAQRYQDAASLAEDLRRVLAGESARARGPGRRVPWWALAAGPVVLIGLGGAWLAARADEAPAATSPPLTPDASREALRQRLRSDFDELLGGDRVRSQHAIQAQAARVVARGEAGGLSLTEIEALKSERWGSAREVWRKTLEEAAQDEGGNPALVLERLRAALESSPAVPLGLPDVSEPAIRLLSNQALPSSPAGERSFRRAVELQIARNRFGLEPPLVLQEQGFARADRPEGYLDLLRLGVPLQFDFAHWKVRQFVERHRETLSVGQLDDFVDLARRLPADWPEGPTPENRAFLEDLVSRVSEAREKRPDLGRRYVLELHFLALRARGTLLSWAAHASPEDPSLERRALDLIRESRELASRGYGVLAFELAEAEDRLWLNVLKQPEKTCETWRTAIANLEREVAVKPYRDCPVLFLGRSHRGLALAHLRVGRPEACLEAVRDSKELWPQIEAALVEAHAEPGSFGHRYHGKAAALGARAHFDLGRLDEAEALLAPFQNFPSYKTNSSLGEISVMLAVARRDRAAALKRLGYWKDIKAREQQYEKLRDLVAEELPPPPAGQ
jgi:protein kinase-like protein